ncbi:MAG: SAM-dependent chlorinase/fluorinase [Eubacteriales bacterium]
MKPILVFQTDFTYKEGAISSMYGVVKSVDRELEIIDGTHELPQYDTWSASYRLYQSLRFWPEGTVYVSVVDPGVGTARKACVAKVAGGYYVVTPDNGALTPHRPRDGRSGSARDRRIGQPPARQGHGRRCDFPRTRSVRVLRGAARQRHHRF